MIAGRRGVGRAPEGASAVPGAAPRQGSAGPAAADGGPAPERCRRRSAAGNAAYAGGRVTGPGGRHRAAPARVPARGCRRLHQPPRRRHPAYRHAALRRHRGHAAGGSADGFAAALRRATPPVIGHIHRDRLLLDLRTVAPQEDDALTAALTTAASAQAPTPAAEVPRAVLTCSAPPPQDDGAAMPRRQGSAAAAAPRTSRFAQGAPGTATGSSQSARSIGPAPRPHRPAQR